jgi:hypothetical protein
LRRRMMGIAIGPAAYAVIATLPGSPGVEPERTPNGDYFVWLEPAVVDRIAALRGPGESYSDVIVRLAAG